MLWDALTVQPNVVILKKNIYTVCQVMVRAEQRRAGFCDCFYVGGQEASKGNI